MLYKLRCNPSINVNSNNSINSSKNNNIIINDNKKFNNNIKPFILHKDWIIE